MTRFATLSLSQLAVAGLLVFGSSGTLYAQQNGGITGLDEIIAESERLHADNDALRQDLEEARAELETLRDRIGTGTSGPTQAELDAAEERASALARDLDALRADLDAARQRANGLEADLNVTQSALAEARQAAEAAEAALGRLRAQAAEANRQLEAALRRNAELESERDDLQRQLEAAGDSVVERVAELESALDAERARSAAEADRADLAETEARQCEADRANCPALPACTDKVTVEWDAPGIARMTVDNPCRGGDLLRVRSSNIRDPLLRALTGRFDSDGRAELVFPVVGSEMRLRVGGAELGSFEDVIVTRPEPLSEGYVILTWENAASDLDLLVARDFAAARLAPDSGFGLRGTGIGEKVLAQDAETPQQPRYEVVAIDPGWTGSLDLGVAHPLRGHEAITPFCADASAASPGFRLYFRAPGELQQALAGEIPEVACGALVPPEQQYYFLRRARF